LNLISRDASFQNLSCAHPQPTQTCHFLSSLAHLGLVFSLLVSLLEAAESRFNETKQFDLFDHVTKISKKNFHFCFLARGIKQEEEIITFYKKEK